MKIAKLQSLLYFITLFISLLLLTLTYLFEDSLSNSIVAFSYLLLGVINIVCLYKETKYLLSSLSIYSMIWLILIPITSFEMPIISQMTIFQWQIVSLANVFFCLGGLLGSIQFTSSSRTEKNSIEDFQLNRIQYITLVATLFFCVILYLIQAFIAGGFPAMMMDADLARRNFYLPNAASISNLGMMPIYLIFRDKIRRRSKLFVFLAVIYFIELYLMAVRFGVMMVIIMILSLFSSKKINLKYLKYLCILSVSFILLFSLIANIRGGNINNIAYFAGIGAYSGSTSTLRNTEILRYIGYSQRLMENYFTMFQPGANDLGYTLSPILGLFNLPFEKVQHLTIWGYTATNIISYLFLDFGRLWPFVYGLWSFMVNGFYYSSINTNSIVKLYLWTIGFIGIILSFYAYIHSYIVWVTLFLLYAILIELLGKISISKISKEHKNEHLYNQSTYTELRR